MNMLETLVRKATEKPRIPTQEQKALVNQLLATELSAIPHSLFGDISIAAQRLYRQHAFDGHETALMILGKELAEKADSPHAYRLMGDLWRSRHEQTEGYDERIQTARYWHAYQAAAALRFTKTDEQAQTARAFRNASAAAHALWNHTSDTSWLEKQYEHSERALEYSQEREHLFRFRNHRAAARAAVDLTEHPETIHRDVWRDRAETHLTQALALVKPNAPAQEWGDAGYLRAKLREIKRSAA